MGVCMGVQVPPGARRSDTPGAGVTGACEPPEMGAGNQTQALGVRSLCSLPELSVQPRAQLCEMGV